MEERKKEEEGEEWEEGELEEEGWGSREDEEES